MAVGLYLRFLFAVADTGSCKLVGRALGVLLKIAGCLVRRGIRKFGQDPAPETPESKSGPQKAGRKVCSER